MTTWIKRPYVNLLVFALIILVILLIPTVIIILLLAAILLYLIPTTRSWFLSTPLYHILKKRTLSTGEIAREAIESDANQWEQDLFNGKPNWDHLLTMPSSQMSKVEQDFLDDETSQLCQLVDDGRIKQDAALSSEVWDFIKTRGFGSMIIPKYYGGLGFSETAYSAIIAKLASRSPSLATTVMALNSPGPVELLMKYGSEKQKAHHLPRLARSEEIPCFALSSLQASSDTNSVADFGIVCEDEFEGQQCTGLRITWDKLYASLASDIGLIGLVIKVLDPQQLLDKDLFHGKEELGITCVLVPAHLSGINKEYEGPASDTFLQNNLISGENVFVPLDYVIGGAEMIGQGQRMLVECSAMKHSLAVSALSMAAQQTALYVSNAYAHIKEQHQHPIAQFESVQKKLARLAIYTSITNATHLLISSDTDEEHKSAVASAIAKYYGVEHTRHIGRIAMDIMQGSKNYLADTYKLMLMPATTEDGDISSRSSMIYNLGTLRYHPYLYQEINCLNEQNESAGSLFDELLDKHFRYHLTMLGRAIGMAWTRARFSEIPEQDEEMQKHYRNVNYISALFACLSSLVVAISGGELKKREIITGYFSDVLAMMYATVALLRQYHERSEPAFERSMVELACTECMHRAEESLHEICLNLPKPFFWGTRAMLFPTGRRIRANDDKSYCSLAEQLHDSDDLRELLTQNIYKEAFKHLAHAVSLGKETAELRSKLKAYPKPLDSDWESWLAELKQQDILNADECEKLKSWQRAVKQAL